MEYFVALWKCVTEKKLYDRLGTNISVFFYRIHASSNNWCTVNDIISMQWIEMCPKHLHSSRFVGWKIISTWASVRIETFPSEDTEIIIKKKALNSLELILLKFLNTMKHIDKNTVKKNLTFKHSLKIYQ